MNNHKEELAAPATERKKPWVTPTSEPQGSVSELVQLAKVSMGEDTDGKRFQPDAPGPD